MTTSWLTIVRPMGRMQSRNLRVEKSLIPRMSDPVGITDGYEQEKKGPDLGF